MSNKSAHQRENLFTLADTIAARNSPLGVGLKSECWAGVAISLANQQGSKTTEFYGLSMREIMNLVKENNRTPIAIRNEVMIDRTLQQATN
jgi:hypothetical protein